MMALVQSELHEEGEKWGPLSKVSYMKRGRNEGSRAKQVTSLSQEQFLLFENFGFFSNFEIWGFLIKFFIVKICKIIARNTDMIKRVKKWHNCFWLIIIMQ